MADSRNRCFTFASTLLLIFLWNHAASANTLTFPVTGDAGQQYYFSGYNISGPGLSLGGSGYGGYLLYGPYYPGSSYTTSIEAFTDGFGSINGVDGDVSSNITWTFSFVMPSDYRSSISVPGTISGTFSVCCRNNTPMFTGDFSGTGTVVADLLLAPGFWGTGGWVTDTTLIDFTGTATIQTTPEPSTLVLLLTGLPLTFYYLYCRRSRVRHA
jgi:hypothetical protein